MQICNLIKKTSVLSALIFFIAAPFFSQSVEMPSMPSMPSMPTIGSPHYHPEMPKFTFPYTNRQKTDTSKESSASTKTATLSDATVKPEDMLTNLISSTNNLSASDITSLYDSGMFKNISGLFGTNFSSTSTTDVLLQQILTSLTELKNQQKNSTPDEQEYYKNHQKDSENFRYRNPSILRFKINGYNINDSLTTVFFSETEPDGSFLLTGDRKYYTGQKMRTETFYFLFKTIKSNGASTTYKVIPSIVQDSENPNSFVYRASKIPDLVAEKTGNLVVIHYTGSDLNMDLLLDIDNKSK